MKDGFDNQCKGCHNKYLKRYYQKNKDKIDKAHKEYYHKNKEKMKKLHADWYQRNRDKVREQHRQYYMAKRNRNVTPRELLSPEEKRERRREGQRRYYHANKDKYKAWKKKWRDTHKEQIRQSAKRYREENRELINKKAVERLHNDPIYKMKEQTRNMVRYALRSKGHRKTSRTAEIVGCDLDALCEHLFATWKKNYGTEWNGEEYHIDHIVPLATAKSEEDVIRLCHYTNLQMLTPEDNMKKSDN